MDSSAVDLLRISSSSTGQLSVELSWWLFVIIVTVTIVVVIWRLIRSRYYLRRFDLVDVEINLGNIGKASFKPNIEDIQVAHKVWVELITRKAANPIDFENDVIVEIYDSWYKLFGVVRDLIGAVPGHLIRQEGSTREVVRITTETLNEGLRPHLTKWQAKFRNWYRQNESRLADVSPQELQREFPQYDELVSDMQAINEKLIQYAGELRKIVHGK